MSKRTEKFDIVAQIYEGKKVLLSIHGNAHTKWLLQLLLMLLLFKMTRALFNREVNMGKRDGNLTGTGRILQSLCSEGFGEEPTYSFLDYSLYLH